MLFVSQGFFYASLVASLLLLFSLMLVACLPETVKSERKRYLSPAEAGKRVFDTYRARGHSHDRALLLLSLLAFLLYLLSSESKVSETHRAEAGGSAERERERVKSNCDKVSNVSRLVARYKVGWTKRKEKKAKKWYTVVHTDMETGSEIWMYRRLFVVCSVRVLRPTATYCPFRGPTQGTLFSVQFCSLYFNERWKVAHCMCMR